MNIIKLLTQRVTVFEPTRPSSDATPTTMRAYKYLCMLGANNLTMSWMLFILTSLPLAFVSDSPDSSFLKKFIFLGVLIFTWAPAWGYVLAVTLHNAHHPKGALWVVVTSVVLWLMPILAIGGIMVYAYMFG